MRRTFSVALLVAAALGCAPAAAFVQPVHTRAALGAARARAQRPASAGSRLALASARSHLAPAGGVFVAAGARCRRGLAPLRATGGADTPGDPAVFNRQPGESEIKTLLTQRALQNLISLLLLQRDQITADWLEAFQGHEGIRRYHGLSGLHMGGRAYLAQLLRTPNEEVVVEFTRRGNGGHGGSPERAAALGAGGNPYLKDHVYEFKEKIEPRRLGDRLMRLRQEMADEWLQDLQLIGKENEEMWRSFFETVREDEDRLKDLQMPVYAHDPSDGASGSTFRGGNYDLLRRLATYKAAQQMLGDYQRGNHEDKAKASFLERMLTVHGSDFEGDAGYSVDKAFLESLLSSPPSMIRATTFGGQESMVLLSPLTIVEEICEARQVIAERWINELSQVADDHTDIQRELLQGSL